MVTFLASRGPFQRSSRSSLVLCLTLLVAPIAFAQSADPAQVPSRPPAISSTDIDDVHVSIAPTIVPTPQTRVNAIRVNVNLVLVPVTVTDTTGHPVLGLQKNDFAVFENDAQQEIRHFSAEDGPISIGLIVDASGSMKDKIESVRAAIDQFFLNANPEDDFLAITVSDRPRLLGDPSQSIDAIQKKLGMIIPQGSTALMDAIYMGAMQLRHARYARRALVIISDGADNNSRYRFKEIKSMLEEADVAVYAIGLFEPSLLRSYEEVVGKKRLFEMTASTGGRTVPVDNLARMSDAAARISWELRSQYLLGYKPQTPVTHDTRRKIKVRLAPQPDQSLLQAHYRKEYSIP